ncbi:zinc-dependent alcohol dehydrogenase family protein [Pseudomarimonas arenosa]|uniref:Zinc-dependent alcohol dehydrogenase family protein n=1 Tax=Pseudomarimonas arenosa TaxID=2774145 RepID=A0AAW3ZKH2_9GAMM|nr:zinc-dependent alcohol dehydrogenase family protein [Pseudomarimonas arenosa]MBD8526516.1 zinc-dependent alcohol dehydrogenase family protein [Pseudomarimonas arenosa]
MHAMCLEAYGQPLVWRELPDPEPSAGELLIQVEACAVCRTDLHVVDGDLPAQPLPIIPGHEVVGRVVKVGAGLPEDWQGQRVGVPWLGHVCGECVYCRRGEENLCNAPEFTGYTRPGGFASHLLAEAGFCFALDPRWQDPVAAAPLLCAGLIGWRCWRMLGEAQRVGLYGFGVAAHLLTQLAVQQQREIYAFTRKGDEVAQHFAIELGAKWAGDSATAPPSELDAAIIFAPVGDLVPQALRAVRKGGVVVCGGIHMSDIPSFPYRWLWQERQIRSVANLTREDGISYFPAAARAGVHAETTRYALSEANRALGDMRQGRLRGAAVLVP